MDAGILHFFTVIMRRVSELVLILGASCSRGLILRRVIVKIISSIVGGSVPLMRG